MRPKLGLIAGQGELPAKIVEQCRRQSRELFVLALEGQTDPALVVGIEHGWTRLGAAAEILSLLHGAGVKELILAGAIRRPSLTELKPDLKAAQIFSEIGLKALGDDGLLRALRKYLEREGFRLVSVQDLSADLLAGEGPLGRLYPDPQADADIELGFRIATRLGELDVGQSVVVQQGLVLGVEAIEGTDALLDRSRVLRRDGPGGVLVKRAKPGQDRQLDLPTIGEQTVDRAAAAGLRGIAIEAGSTIILDRAAVAAAADRLGLFVIGRNPDAPAPLFYLIAGEPSGDALGARLMQALRTRTDGAARFAGIGGERMEEAGLNSLLPIRELAIMGIFEVLPKARQVLRWVRETATEIERLRPAAVVTIDSSGFCFRVAERLRRKPGPPLIVHYVAPMVWAWRAHRAKHAAGAADHLLTLLPFEPPYFEKVGLPATFVGHPAIEEEAGDAAAFRARHGVGDDAMVLCVLPGSRRGEVRRLLPIFLETARRLSDLHPGLVVVIPTVDTVAAEVEAATGALPFRVIVVRGASARRDAFAASTAALAASGTVALELARAGVPMVVSYRIASVAAAIYRRVVKARYACLINILLDRMAVPELIQETCNPDQLTPAVELLFADQNARAAQHEACDAALAMLGRDEIPPSLRAADKILELVKERQSANPAR